MSTTRKYTVTFWPEGMDPIEVDIRAHDEQEAFQLARDTLVECDASITEATR